MSPTCVVFALTSSLVLILMPETRPEKKQALLVQGQVTKCQFTMSGFIMLARTFTYNNLTYLQIISTMLLETTC